LSVLGDHPESTQQINLCHELRLALSFFGTFLLLLDFLLRRATK
jgi:hypothetical protein